MNTDLQFKRKPEKRRMRLRFGVWLLWMVLLAIGQQMWAADWNLTDPNYYIVTNNQQNGYVTIKILFYDDDGDNEYIREGDGKLKIKIGNKAEEELLTYGSPTRGSDVPRAKAIMRLNKGFAVFKTETGDQGGGTGSHEYWFRREGEYLTYLTFDWYYPSECEGEEMKFIIDSKIWVNNQDNQQFNRQIGTANARSFSNPTLSDPAFSPTEVGKYQMTYSTTTAPIQIWNSVSGSWSSSTATSGTLFTKTQNTKGDYTFKVKYQLNKYYKSKEYSVTKTLPAFHQAQNFKPTDIENGDTKLTWNIANNESNCQTGDAFEIQRADNKEYSSPTTIGQVSFDRTKTAYEFIDRTGNLNINGSTYYRIRRTKQPAWNWGLSETCNITKNISHQNVVSAIAQRLNWDSSQQAKISWTLDEKTTNKVWTDGAQVIVKRTMDYGRNNTRTEEIPAMEEDLRNGYMIDDLNVSCVNYTYTVYVKPGNNNYTAQKEVTATIKGEPILPSQIGKITSIVASKGYYPNRTTVQWETDGNPIENFEILGREYKAGQNENDNWIMLQTVTGSSQASYIYNHELGHPGIMYEYRIVATLKCVDETIREYSKIERGFRSPTGTIAGQILFKYGDAVVGAEVLAVPKDPQLKAGQSLSFAGNSSSYMETRSEMDVPEDASLQLFVKPRSTGQNVMLFKWDRYAIGIQDGKAAISANGGTSWHKANAALPTNKFTQLTAVFDTDQKLWLYIDGEKVLDIPASGNVQMKGEKAKATIGKGFAGLIDEVRVWSKALDEDQKEVSNTYNRILEGNEEGLTGYWRLNDPISDEAYDLAYTGTNYHKNRIILTNATPVDEYPTNDQLGFRAFTGPNGNYQISGLSYVGTSSIYMVTPRYPGHQFTPTSINATLGSSQPVVNSVDFEDNSSITVSGYVFYQNSSVPVQDATFTVDGTLVTDGSGAPVKSGKDGKFTFTVSSGTHTVRVEKKNHTFENDGRLLGSNGANINYQDALTDVRFWDQTKVKLIGRVAGGTVEQNKPLGFSTSKNNLGDNICLKLTLEGNASADLSNEDKTEKIEHYDSSHSNDVEYKQSEILIHADNTTGEFTAWLYPEKYRVEEIRVTGYDNLLASSQTLNLENCFEEQTSEYTDGKGATHRFTYNAQYNYGYRVNPVLTYEQLERKGGKALDYFGDQTFQMMTQRGENEEIRLYDPEKKSYLFGLPVFHAAKYYFKVASHEDYYYNNQKNVENVRVDMVPTQGGELKIINKMQSSSEPGSATLDENGTVEVEINVNEADITGVSKGKKTLDFKPALESSRKMKRLTPSVSRASMKFPVVMAMPRPTPSRRPRAIRPVTIRYM